MAIVTLRRTEIYAVDTESEANQVIADATKFGGELTKKVIEVKQKKSKGEIVDEKLKVTTQVDFAGLWDAEGEE